MLSRLWCGWNHALFLVQPETVLRWHRTGFKMYWTWLSRHQAPAGRNCISKELRELIFRMVTENSTWGAPSHASNRGGSNTPTMVLLETRSL